VHLLALLASLLQDGTSKRVGNALKQRTQVDGSLRNRSRIKLRLAIGSRRSRCSARMQSPADDARLRGASERSERVVLAPATDSRWDELIVAVLAALDNRLVEAAANIPNQSRRAKSSSVGTVASIQKVALSPREMNAIVQAGNAPLQIAASAFSGGSTRTSTVRVGADRDWTGCGVAVTGRTRSVCLKLMARTVLAEIGLVNSERAGGFLARPRYGARSRSGPREESLESRTRHGA